MKGSQISGLALSEECVETAELVSRKIGYDVPLRDLAPEHWRLVLVIAEAKMRDRGIAAPVCWERKLAQQIGRSGG